MKTLSIIFFVLICCQSALMQQFPISCFKMYSGIPSENPSNFTHTQQIAKTFPQYQNAYFNYGQAFIQTSYGLYPPAITDAQVRELLDSAAAHNVKMILNSVVDGYTAIERFYLQATDQYFGFKQGNIISPDNDAESPSFYYQKTSLQATVSNDYMVKSAIFQPFKYNGALYNAVYRLKASGYSATTQIAEIGGCPELSGDLT